MYDFKIYVWYVLCEYYFPQEFGKLEKSSVKDRVATYLQSHWLL